MSQKQQANRRVLSNLRNNTQKVAKSALKLSPPPFQSTIQVSKIFRFQASAALVNSVISFADLGDLMFVALTAVTGADLFEAFKLNRVDIWGPMASSLTPVTVSVEYPSVGAAANNGGPSRIKSDTSMGSARPAFVSAKPAPSSAQSFWQSAFSVSPFIKLNGPTGSVVDVHITYVLQENKVTAPSAPIVGATPGTLYVRKLDQLFGGLLVPLSYVTA